MAGDVAAFVLESGSVFDGAFGGLGPATEVVARSSGCMAAVAQLLQLTFKALFRVAAG